MKQLEITGAYQKEFMFFDNGPENRVSISTIRLPDGSEATVKGPLRQDELARHLQVRFYGVWKDHHKYGRQFVFTSHVVEEPATEAGVTAYLQMCRGPEGEKLGIGRTTALNLFAEFGPQAVEILRTDPDRACKDIPRFTAENARKAAEWLRANHAIERARIDMIGLLNGRGFPRKTVEEAIQTWGSGAADAIRRNPYLLMRFRGCGFGNTDKMYLALGHPPDRLKRQALCAWNMLNNDSSGDTWFPLRQAHGAITSSVAGTNVNAERATMLATRAGMLTVREHNGTRWVALAARAQAEETAALCIAESLEESGQWPDVSEIEIGEDDQHQREQLAVALSGGPVAVLCGSPGSGKTHTAAALIRHLISVHGLESVAACAPTGKAAARLNIGLSGCGVAGLKATTIHSLLKAQHGPGGFAFEHNAGNPIPFRWVIIDEPSMVDTGLMAALLAARSPNTHYLFVGDTNQLPPVGHGAPLRDLIQAGVPCGELTEVRRNSGRIVRACAEIRDRHTFETSRQLDLSKGENLSVIRRHNSDDQLEALLVEFRQVQGGQLGELDATWDCQVIVSVNRDSPLSRTVLNRKLQSALNPDGDKAPGNPFRVGDKLINLKNGTFPPQDPDDPECGPDGKIYVANGEQAEVLYVEPARTIASLQDPPRIIIIPHGQQEAGEDDEDRGTAGTWDLGYAITAHKSQGSEWPIVFLMIDEHGGARRMLNRNLVYTAISRGKLATIGIGKVETLQDACRRDGIGIRKTFLVEQIQENLPDDHPLKPKPRPAPLVAGPRHIGSVLDELAASRPDLDLSILRRPASPAEQPASPQRTPAVELPPFDVEPATASGTASARSAQSSTVMLLEPDEPANDWQAAVEQCIRIQELCEQVPERGEDFAADVAERAGELCSTIEETEHVTVGQQTALDNWQAGLERWIR